MTEVMTLVRVKLKDGRVLNLAAGPDLFFFTHVSLFMSNILQLCLM